MSAPPDHNIISINDLHLVIIDAKTPNILEYIRLIEEK